MTTSVGNGQLRPLLRDVWRYRCTTASVESSTLIATVPSDRVGGYWPPTALLSSILFHRHHLFPTSSTCLAAWFSTGTKNLSSSILFSQRPRPLLHLVVPALTSLLRPCIACDFLLHILAQGLYRLENLCASCRFCPFAGFFHPNIWTLPLRNGTISLFVSFPASLGPLFALVSHWLAETGNPRNLEHCRKRKMGVERDWFLARSVAGATQPVPPGDGSMYRHILAPAWAGCCSQISFAVPCVRQVPVLRVSSVWPARPILVSIGAARSRASRLHSTRSTTCISQPGRHAAIATLTGRVDGGRPALPVVTRICCRLDPARRALRFSDARLESLPFTDSQLQLLGAKPWNPLLTVNNWRNSKRR